MSNLAFTWIYNDMVALELWCKYYSRYFEDLAVLCCGTNIKYYEKLEELKKKYNLHADRLEGNDYDPTMANNIIKTKQILYLQDHEWVLYSNCDEIVTTFPKKYKDLKDFMTNFKGKWRWCIGYEVLREEKEPELDYSKPILKQRTFWLKNPSMNKVVLSRTPLNWNDGQHQIEETRNLEIKVMRNKGLLLLHLKHADPLNLPNRDLVINLRPPYNYVLENFEKRREMPTWVKEII